jgi:Protein of unknown function (DUF4242)
MARSVIGRKNGMLLYMDIHEIEGATADDLARAHAADVQIQEQYGVERHKYWFNERSEKVTRLGRRGGFRACRPGL